MRSDTAAVEASPAPVVCTIAGSDSSGSSGIQADLATFAALGVHGTTVLTVVTAQDTVGVSGFFELDPSLVAAQLDAVVGDLAPRATKTGLLRSIEVVEIVVAAAAKGRLGLLVVDPVLVDSAGRGIVADGVIDRYRRLAAHATALTPNRWEAELLIDTALPDTDAVIASAPLLRQLGAPLVVVTGGRSDDDVVVDVVVTADGQNSGDLAIDNLEHNELIILALAGVAMSITGGFVFLRYSLARFFRFWLLRQIYESRTLIDELGAARPAPQSHVSVEDRLDAAEPSSSVR